MDASPAVARRGAFEILPSVAAGLPQSESGGLAAAHQSAPAPFGVRGQRPRFDSGLSKSKSGVVAAAPAFAQATAGRLQMVLLAVVVLSLLGGCGGKQGVAQLPAEATVRLANLEPAVSVPATTAATPPLPQDVRDELERGRRHLAARDYAQAVNVLQHANQMNPSCAQILADLGTAYAGMEARDRALECLGQSAALGGDNLHVHVLLGEVLARNGNDAQAIVALRTALCCSQAKAERAEAADALMRLGLLLRKAGYWTASLECFQTLEGWIHSHGAGYVEPEDLRNLTRKPERLLLWQGELLLRLGHAEQAVQVTRRSFDRDRTDAATARVLADALLAARQYDQAESLIVELAGEESQARQLPTLLEGLCRASGNKEVARRFWQRCQKRYRLRPALALGVAGVMERLGQTPQAEQLLQSVLEEMPGSAGVAAELARLYAESGRIWPSIDQLVAVLVADAAQETTVRACARDVLAAKTDLEFVRKMAAEIPAAGSSNAFALHYLAAVLAESLNDAALAGEQYKLAIGALPSFAPAAERLVDLLLENRLFDQALREIDRLPSGTPAGTALYLRGKVCLAQGQFAEAIQSLQQSCQADPQHVPALLLMAKAFEANGRPEAATGALVAAVNTDPGNADIYRDIFRLYCRLNQLSEAQIVIRRFAERFGDDPRAGLMQARLDLASGSTASALRRVEELKARLGEDGELTLLTIRANFQASHGLLSPRELDEAVRQLVALLTRNSDDLECLETLVMLLDRRPAPPQAIKAFEELYRKCSRGAFGRLYAKALADANRQADSAVVLEGLLKTSPDDAWLQRMLLEALSKSDMPAAIRRAEAWQADTASGPKKLWFRLRLLRLYGQAKEFQKAIDAAHRWTQEKPADPAVKQLLLSLLADGKQYDLAQTLLEEWIPGSDGQTLQALREQKVDILVRQDRPEAARQFVLQWQREAPASLAPKSALIGSLCQSKQYDIARKLLDQWLGEVASATAPAGTSLEVSWARVTSVRLLTAQGQFEQALQQAQQFLRGEPGNTDLLTLIATCQGELGRDDQALATMERAAGLQRDNVVLANNLGYLYADRGVQLKKAEQLVLSALAKDATSTSVLDSLGWVYYKQGRFQEAARLFDQILQLPDSPEGLSVVLDHAGDAYYRLGRYDKALDAWRQAVAAAEKEEIKLLDVRNVSSRTPAKIEALQANGIPAVAPIAPPEPVGRKSK